MAAAAALGAADLRGLDVLSRQRARPSRSMTTIWIDSRKRAAGRDEDFEFDIGETVHLQSSARLGVFKIRVADTFLSTDRGAYLYWKDTALGTLNWAQLPTARADRFEELLMLKHHAEHRAAQRAADAAPVLEEASHLQPQRYDAAKV